MRIFVRHLEGSRRGDRQRIQREDEGEITFGRDPASHVTFDLKKDDEASWQHAVIQIRKGRLVLRDLGSTNGTYLNGRAIEEEELQNGDEIRFGPGGPRILVAFGSLRRRLLQAIRSRLTRGRGRKS